MKKISICLIFLTTASLLLTGCGRSVTLGAKADGPWKNSITLQANAEDVREGLRTLDQARTKRDAALLGGVGAGLMLAHGMSSWDASEENDQRATYLFAGSAATGLVVSAMMPSSSIGGYSLVKLEDDNGLWKVTLSKNEQRITLQLKEEAEEGILVALKTRAMTQAQVEDFIATLEGWASSL